jgi:hypothetical protein
MEPEELLDCEMCQYRKSILDHLGKANRAMGDAVFDALVAYGPESDTTLIIRDARIAIDAVFNRILGEGLRCEGDEEIACPMNDKGYRW